MREPIRIANCSGFYGDRITAAREMVEGGAIDVLTGDWLAELTMLILARTRAKSPSIGYARTFLTQMEQVMGSCLERGIKVVSNAGGLEPERCADAVAEIAARLGLSPRVAFVSGDDLMARLDDLMGAGADFAVTEDSRRRDGTASFLTANVYFGCFGIVEALARGADIVVTGRVTDAALVCGPAAWHHGWGRDDLDELAGAVVAGHAVECGAQVTGGNYSFFTEVAGLDRVGFPWVEVAADGSSVVGKHDGTGGQVSRGTVTAQLLYEIAGPAYLGPDVTARFDTIELDEVGPDRVRISAVRGDAPPATLKVALNEVGGYRTDLRVALTGLDVEAKARLVEEAFWSACAYRASDYDEVVTQLVRTDKPDPATNDEAVATWRLTLRDRDANKLGRVVTDAAVEIALASVPGYFLAHGGSSGASPYGVFRAASVARHLVPQHVTVLGDGCTVVDSLAPRAPAETIERDESRDGSRATSDDACTGATTRAPLGRVVGARSGDKGGDANLGVFTRSDAAWVWLDSFLTVAELRRLLPETEGLAIDRYRLPRLRALNFVIHGLLGDGVAASSRADAQAKGLGEWLRSRVVAIPEDLLAP